MTLPLLAALIALAGYIAGATPFGYLTARFVAGMDIRKEGSGNIGATNIGRVLGAKWGLAVLALDALKGLLPVLIVPWVIPAEFADDGQHLQVLCGLCTIVGHMFPFWLRFKGGKGVATALGVVIGLGTWAMLIAFGVFVLSFAVARIVSLSSILAAITFAVAQMFFLKPSPFAEETWSAGVFSLLVPTLILWRHRSNITRLLRGEEKRFRFGKSSEEKDKPADECSPGEPVASNESQGGTP